MATQTNDHTLKIAGVRFYEIGKLYHFSCDHLPDLRVGEFVIVETTRGRQMGQVMNILDGAEDANPRDYKPILRMASPQDLMNQKLWKGREVEALVTCREKAVELGGFEDAKFVTAQYNFDGTLLTFLFSSEDKVNTSKLKSVLQRGFKAKIELRQIGPRDVAKVLGGMGACGITRCCSTFLTEFSPISIKMAKVQGISLNPSEITGMCGRLRCCLIYEYEQYVEARGQLPKRNKRVGTPFGEGRVIDVHPLRDAVTVQVEEAFHVVPREDLIPMEEWEAFKAKAEAGCTKSEGESCSSTRHRAAAEEDQDDEDDLDADLGEIISLDEAAPSQEETQQPSKHSKRGRQRRGRGGPDRGRSRRGKRRPSSENEENES